jgi:hypothetical protein
MPFKSQEACGEEEALSKSVFERYFCLRQVIQGASSFLRILHSNLAKRAIFWLIIDLIPKSPIHFGLQILLQAKLVRFIFLPSKKTHQNLLSRHCISWEGRSNRFNRSGFLLACERVFAFQPERLKLLQEPWI